MVSLEDQIPPNEVFKYSWKGDDDDLDTTISYLDEKGGAECDDCPKRLASG